METFLVLAEQRKPIASRSTYVTLARSSATFCSGDVPAKMACSSLAR